MKSVTLAFRKAIYSALANIVYDGEVITVFEEEVQETPTKQLAVLTVGNMEVKVWIILNNQVSNDISAKCERNDEAGIQIQIKAEFPSSKGNSVIAEEISELVMARLLNRFGLLGIVVMTNPFELWKLDLVGTRNLNYSNDDTRLWSTIMILLGSITQKGTATGNIFFGTGTPTTEAEILEGQSIPYILNNIVIPFNNDNYARNWFATPIDVVTLSEYEQIGNPLNRGNIGSGSDLFGAYVVVSGFKLYNGNYNTPLVGNFKLT